MEIITKYFEQLNVVPSDDIFLSENLKTDGTVSLSMKQYLLGLDSAIIQSSLFLKNINDYQSLAFDKTFLLFCQSNQLMINLISCYQELLNKGSNSYQYTFNQLFKFPYHTLCRKDAFNFILPDIYLSYLKYFSKEELNDYQSFIDMPFDAPLLIDDEPLRIEKIMIENIAKHKNSKGLIQSIKQSFDWYQSFIHSSNEVTHHDIDRIHHFLLLLHQLFPYYDDQVKKTVFVLNDHNEYVPFYINDVLK